MLILDPFLSLEQVKTVRNIKRNKDIVSRLEKTREEKYPDLEGNLSAMNIFLPSPNQILPFNRRTSGTRCLRTI
jgi:hypothetical protein